MQLYSRNSEYPKQIPFRIKLSNGMTRTDPSTFTAEEIADAGFVAVENPPSVEYPNKLDWDTETAQWIVRAPSDAEISSAWNNIRIKRNKLLAESDILVIRAYESNLPVSAEIVQYRQALRDITLQESPWSIIWPIIINEDNTEGQ